MLGAELAPEYSFIPAFFTGGLEILHIDVYKLHEPIVFIFYLLIMLKNLR